MSEVAPAIETDNHAMWTRLERSPEWTALTKPQQTWSVVYLATGNAVEATRYAYHTKSESNTRVLSYELAKNPRILAALDAAKGIVRSEKDALVSEVRAQLRAAEKGSIAATKLVAMLKELTHPGINAHEAKADAADHETDSQPDPEPRETHKADAPKFYVGQIVTQRDDDGVVHSGMVTAIGQDGLPSQIQEIGD